MALFTNLLAISQPRSLRHELAIPKYQVLNIPAALHGRFTCSGGQFNDVAAPKLFHQKQRRSANYPPPNWDFEILQSTKSEYVGGMFIERSNVLKEQVKRMLDDELNPIRQLELIDDLQRLGIFYHFEGQIQSILRRIYNENSSNNIMPDKKGLYETALEFRLFRQHHFHVPQEVFYCFRCEKGDFKASLIEDTKGLLCLYEASFLLTENESTLEMARDFTMKILKRNVEENRVFDPELDALVRHALELPLHWRMSRLEARWFIDVYEKLRPDMNPTILEFAKLDFNIVQAIHQMDLAYALRWWKSTGFGEKLEFARDRVVENFFWAIGVAFYPQYGYFRRRYMKANALITTMDDIYDVYGTLDELELFTHAVERWEISAIDKLPDYMKIFYVEFYKAINEMASEVLKEHGVHVISHIRKAWTDLCGAYMQEAKWYSNGYIPTLQEYLSNACISISVPVLLEHAYSLVSKPIKKEALECIDGCHNIIHCSAMILRLLDDLGTSTEELKRGDVSKSIQCYMNETGATEEEAREYIKLLIYQTWKEMNAERLRESPFPKIFIEMAMNIDRMAQCMYENGDGHGHSDPITRERISALLFEPIRLAKA